MIDYDKEVIEDYSAIERIEEEFIRREEEVSNAIQNLQLKPSWTGNRL